MFWSRSAAPRLAFFVGICVWLLSFGVWACRFSPLGGIPSGPTLGSSCSVFRRPLGFWFWDPSFGSSFLVLGFVGFEPLAYGLVAPIGGISLDLRSSPLCRCFSLLLLDFLEHQWSEIKKFDGKTNQRYAEQVSFYFVYILVLASLFGVTEDPILFS